MWFLTGLLLVLATALAVPLSDVKIYNLEEAEKHFEEFIQTYNRNYASPEEKMIRFEAFKINLRKINERNAMRTQEYHAVHGFTSFVDYTEEEIAALHGGLKPLKNDVSMINLNVTGFENFPEELDWRMKNKVTPVRDQGMCGSCWAFGAVACLESLNAIKNNELSDFSEQQLVDCDKKSLGCRGARTVSAGHDAFARMGGAMLEKDYPYKERQVYCRFDKSKIAVKVSGFKVFNIIKKEVTTLKKILNDIGPVSVALNAEQFHTYKSGIIEGDSDKPPNHVVAIVGYGIYKGVPYWLLKNSWGTDMGEKGYVKIKAGENTCNIKKMGVAIVELS